MRKNILSALLIVLCVVPCAVAETSAENFPQANEQWNETAKAAAALSQSIEKRAGVLEKYVHEDKVSLKKRIALLKKKYKAQQRELRVLKKELKNTTALRSELDDAFERATSDMKTLEGTVHSAVKQVESSLASSPVTALYPNRLAPMVALQAERSFPSVRQLEGLVDVLLQEAQHTGRVTTHMSSYIGEDGLEKKGAVVQAGGFFLGYLGDDESGFLTPATPLPVAWRGLSSSINHSVVDWATDSETMLVDITGGAALEAQARQRSFTGWVEAGGLLLYPILAIGVVALLAILFKFFRLSTERCLPKGSIRELGTFIHNRDWEGCSEYLEQFRRTPAAKVLRSGLRFRAATFEALESGLQEAQIREYSRLERMLPLIGVLAAIAPLLGLLGTVTGMIGTFQTITVFGTGDPRMLSSGISEALITTQAGLGVAIPLMLCHHVLKRRIQTLLDDMEKAGAGFSALIASEAGTQGE